MNKNNAFYIITIVIIIVLFLVFQPKILPKLFGIRNQTLLNRFVAHTQQTGKIDVQEFWKMREFYCPGRFVFDKTKNPFLVYDCTWLHSEDYLSGSLSLPPIANPEKNNVIFHSGSVIIFKVGKKMTISFVVPEEEMKKAVGFFDYAEKDKELVNGKNWYDVTVISL